MSRVPCRGAAACRTVLPNHLTVRRSRIFPENDGYRRSACAAGPEASGRAARREGCFTAAIARQPLQCVFALAGGGELGAANARTVSSIW